MKKRNHLLLWLVLFPLLAIAAVYTVVSANQNFSTDIFLTYLSQVQPVWLAAAVGCTLCYIFWEGLSLHTICRRLDSPSRLGRGVVWSAADIFFSAVTPSATGGQPASAWYMLRAGVPGSVCSVALLLNLVLYTLSILVIAPIAIALCPGVLATFCLPARWFIVVGAVLQLALAGLFLLLLVRPGLVERIALWCLDLLSRGRLRLRAEQWRAALAKKMPEYRACTQVLRRDWRLLAAAFLLQPPAKAVPSSGAGVPSFGLGRIPTAGAPCSGHPGLHHPGLQRRASARRHGCGRFPLLGRLRPSDPGPCKHGACQPGHLLLRLLPPMRPHFAGRCAGIRNLQKERESMIGFLRLYGRPDLLLHHLRHRWHRPVPGRHGAPPSGRCYFFCCPACATPSMGRWPGPRRIEPKPCKTLAFKSILWRTLWPLASCRCASAWPCGIIVPLTPKPVPLSCPIPSPSSSPACTFWQLWSAWPIST